MDNSGYKLEILFTFKYGLLHSAENASNALSGMLDLKPSNGPINYDFLKRCLTINRELADFHEAELKHHLFAKKGSQNDQA